MIPLGAPGPMTEVERFLFDVFGYLVIPGALTSGEVDACLEASKRLHTPLSSHLTPLTDTLSGAPPSPPYIESLREPSQPTEWRQLGATYEKEPAIEQLMDHPSILPKVRALLGDRFIIQSSWNTVSPAHYPGQGFHQDGSGPYEFRRLALPTPLVQLRVGYFLTDQSQPNMGNIRVIPGSHNASVPIPDSCRQGEGLESAALSICGKPGDALMFHQGIYHGGGPNEMDYPRYIIHMVYAPPWLLPSDRKRNDSAFLERTTPLRRALVGEWNRPEEPFGVGYEAPPFPD